MRPRRASKPLRRRSGDGRHQAGAWALSSHNVEGTFTASCCAESSCASVALSAAAASALVHARSVKHGKWKAATPRCAVDKSLGFVAGVECRTTHDGVAKADAAGPARPGG